MAFYKGNIYFLFSREWINSKEDGGLWSDFEDQKIIMKILKKLQYENVMKNLIKF